MFNKEEKEFRCNHCKKVIDTGEVVWTKWPFPPKASAYQLNILFIVLLSLFVHHKKKQAVAKFT